MKLRALKKAVPVGLAMCVAGCATAPGLNGGVAQTFNDTFNNQDPCSNNARNTGMVLGGIAGALIGAKLGDKDKGAVLAGVLLGTAAGGFIGADMDKRRCDLAKVAREYQLQMTFAAVSSNGEVVTDAELSRASNPGELKKNAIGNIVSLQDAGGQGGHFESNSDVLTSRAEKYFSAIADIYNQDVSARQIADPQQRQNALRAGAERKLLLVGHTDDTGSSNVNAALSERRARAVAQYLERRGIPRDQVYYQGAGEVYPNADNNTDDGRARNRRVEIVELSSAGNFSKYLEARRPNYQFYRAVQAKAAVSATSEQPAAQSKARTPVLAAKAQASRTGDVAQPRQAKARDPVRIAAMPTPAAKPASKPTTARPAATIPVAPTVGRPIDFGGSPLAGRVNTASGIGKLENRRSLFSLISNAYADEMPVLSDCSQDRPRISGAVKALKDGATYKVNEHVPGLYGKSWTERVNGHQIVINKVAVLASEASLAQIPELKVYADYDPAKARNPKPDVALRPDVNTYLGEGGILYRIFTNGAAGMQCVDILYNRHGGASAKGGNIVYVHDNRLYVTAFKPVIAN